MVFQTHFLKKDRLASKTEIGWNHEVFNLFSGFKFFVFRFRIRSSYYYHADLFYDSLPKGISHLD